VVTLGDVLITYDLLHWKDYILTAHGWLVWGDVHRWTIAGVIGGGMVMIIILAASRTPRPPSQTQPTTQGYGTAHLSSRREIRQHGLYAREGIYVGRAYGMDLRVPRSHLAIIGPSECGKTLCVSASTEAEFDGSVMALCIKPPLTMEARRTRGNIIHVFEPRRHGAGRINLLGFVPFGQEEEVAAIHRVSEHLTDPGAVSQSAGAMYYRAANQRVLEAVFLYQGNYMPPASFGHAYAAMGAMPPMLAAMSREDHPLVKSVADELLGLPAPKRSELWQSARHIIREFGDPILARNTDETTIDLASLQFGAQPQTVYIRVTPDDARGSLRNFIRLLFDQHIAMAGARQDIRAFRHHELVNLDDQNEIGYLAAADHIGSFYREHGLWLMSTFQSFEQLGSYGKDASLLDNSKTWVVFRPNHTKSAEIISAKLGTTTVKDVHETRVREGINRTSVLHARPLMTPFEVEHIPDFHAFVFRGGVAPILAQQVMFTERRLRGA
jgi:type IV secretory pathway TraG/TraD family ATPase VirD4